MPFGFPRPPSKKKSNFLARDPKLSTLEQLDRSRGILVAAASGGLGWAGWLAGLARPGPARPGRHVSGEPR